MRTSSKSHSRAQARSSERGPAGLHRLGLFVPKPSSVPAKLRDRAVDMLPVVQCRPQVYARVRGDRHSVSHPVSSRRRSPDESRLGPCTRSGPRSSLAHVSASWGRGDGVDRRKVMRRATQISEVPIGSKVAPAWANARESGSGASLRLTGLGGFRAGLVHKSVHVYSSRREIRKTGL
jgi:hypothetical protein